MAAIMNGELFGKSLIDEVNKYHGIKTTDLIYKTENKHGVPKDAIEKLIQDLITDCKLIEIEYTIDMKSVGGFLLPANTRINVRGMPPAPPRRI